MKILITGATGFVGRHLIQYLRGRESSEYEIYSLVRSESKFKHLKLDASTTMVLADLEQSGDDSWVEQLPDDLDVVIHSAALVHSFDHQQFYRVNVDGTERLLRAPKGRYSDRNLKFVLSSSQAAAGPADGRKELLVESDDDRPVSHYGRSKLASEELVAKQAPESWSWVALRPPIVLGPNDQAILDIIKMIKGRVILVPGMMGGWKKRYSFISIFDLVEMIKRVVDHSFEQQRETLFVAYPNSITFGELISQIALQTKVKRMVRLPIPLALLGPVAWIFWLIYRGLGFEFRLTPDKVSELRPSVWLCSSERSVELLGNGYQWDLARTVSSIGPQSTGKNY